ncbi:hypothetical protein HDU84_006931 [Entophlyctis sp. JEL0112]|nr:hypothetical protein HDU84_006931 [Entophlyctis sp. JEL0112]
MRYNWLVSLTACLGGILFGYEIGVIAQVLGMPSFLVDFDMARMDGNATLVTTPNYTSNSSLVTASLLIGCIVGAAVLSMVVDLFGRKYSILIGSVVYTAGYALQTSSSPGALTTLLAGRAVAGLGIGVVTTVVPLYINETAPPASRGALTSVHHLMITFGIVLATSANSLVIHASPMLAGVVSPWRIALLLQAVPAILLCGAVIFIPRSPRWLCEKGKHAEGLEVIAQLRNRPATDETVVDEYEALRDSIDFERSIGDSSWSELFHSDTRGRALVGVVNQTFQQLSGINVVLYYSPSLFPQMGFDAYSSLIYFPLGNAFINFAGTFPAMWAVDKFGRKPLLQWGGFVIGVSHSLVFMFLVLAKLLDNQLFSWGAVLSLFVFLIAYSATWGPVVWAYQAEIFPLRVRAKGTGLATMTNWTWNAIVAWAFPPIFVAFEYQPYVYIIFAVSGFLSSVWSTFCVPETKGLSIDEIDAVFGAQSRRNAKFF